jgi:hypothetical protein
MDDEPLDADATGISLDDDLNIEIKRAKAQITEFKLRGVVPWEVTDDCANIFEVPSELLMIAEVVSIINFQPEFRPATLTPYIIYIDEPFVPYTSATMSDVEEDEIVFSILDLP